MTDATPDPIPGASLGKCAICGRPAVEKFKPFCSPRCATLDLGRWLGEGYAVPVDPESDDPEDFFLPPESHES